MYTTRSYKNVNYKNVSYKKCELDKTLTWSSSEYINTGARFSLEVNRELGKWSE